MKGIHPLLVEDFLYCCLVHAVGVVATKVVCMHVCACVGLWISVCYWEALKLRRCFGDGWRRRVTLCDRVVKAVFVGHGRTGGDAGSVMAHYGATEGVTI